MSLHSDLRQWGTADIKTCPDLRASNLRVHALRSSHFSDGPMSNIRSSFDHLVGHRKQRGWHGETKRLRRLEIDHQFEFGRLADRNLAWVRAFQDLTDNVSDVVTIDRDVGPIGHQPSGFDEQLKWVHRGQSAYLGQLNDQLSVGHL